MDIENYYKELTESLIKRLKYLETLECRKVMNEEARIHERRIVTYQFRCALLRIYEPVCDTMDII